MKRLVVFTGAGISADSGIATFRDSNGLWANYRIEDVCTPEALVRNRKLVIDFYNERRKEVLSKKPNAGHLALKELENHFDVRVITQNIDNLHERAGSSHVLHLHGEITKLRSSNDDLATVPLEGWEQPLDMRHPDGSLLRPYVVFFGEAVPYFEKAIEIAQTADIFVVVGTSLAVYPAASLIYNIRPNVPVYLVDPGQPALANVGNKVTHIKEKSATGLPKLVNILINNQ